MNELNKSDHSYNNIALWDVTFAVEKEQFFTETAEYSCHVHSSANSLWDHEHSFPVFKFKPALLKYSAKQETLKMPSQYGAI